MTNADVAWDPARYRFSPIAGRTRRRGEPGRYLCSVFVWRPPTAAREAAGASEGGTANWSSRSRGGSFGLDEL